MSAPSILGWTVVMFMKLLIAASSLSDVSSNLKIIDLVTKARTLERHQFLVNKLMLFDSPQH